MKAEAENQALEGSSEAVDSDPKQLARELLEAGSSPEEVMEQTGLSKAVVLGLLGALRKAQKKLAATEDKAAKGSPSENVGQEEITADFKKEAQIANSAVVAARGKQRLKSLDPDSYKSLYGGQQSEGNSPSRTLLDLETARYVKSMRLEEEAGHQNNGDSQATLGLQKQIDNLKEEMHKKDVEGLQKQSDKLQEEIRELRTDLRSSAGSNSDLAVVVRETSNLIGKALESPGVLRNYLLPADVYIKDKAEAPLLHQQTGLGTRSVVSELRGRGLVTKIIERKGD